MAPPCGIRCQEIEHVANDEDPCGIVLDRIQELHNDFLSGQAGSMIGSAGDESSERKYIFFVDGQIHFYTLAFEAAELLQSSDNISPFLFLFLG